MTASLLPDPRKLVHAATLPAGWMHGAWRVLGPASQVISVHLCNEDGAVALVAELGVRVVGEEAVWVRARMALKPGRGAWLNVHEAERPADVVVRASAGTAVVRW